MDLVQVAVKCPYCGSNFNCVQVSSWIDTGIRNTELRQDFAGTAPQLEQYAICTCPACGKSDWTNQFASISEPAVLNQARLTPHLQFRSAAVYTQQDKGDFYNAGILYLYAAWCADDSRALPQAQEYRRCAIQSFTKSLQDGSCPINERGTVEYLIGELYRRIGDFNSAQSYLSSSLPRLPGKLAYMARKIIKLAVSGNSELNTFDPPG
jgi:uncharacterized protein (DUF2225 family)